MTCASHVVDPSFQLQPGAGVTGPVDCTAHAASNGIDHATCGLKDPTGRSIRLATNEPLPDPRSPGLNLGQVAAVALRVHGVYLDVRTGSRAVSFDEYDRRTMAGQGGLVQVQYSVIADTNLDAGRGFRGGHAMFENQRSTFDSLADGRAAGVFRHDGRRYPRLVMKRAAGALVINAATATRVGFGKVWAAFTRDVIPDYRAAVPGVGFFRYFVKDGVITGRKSIGARRFSGRCTVPLSRPWPKARRRYSLVRITDRRSAYFDWYISAQFADEV